MNELTFDELFERLRTHDESLEIEAKRTSDVDKASWKPCAPSPTNPADLEWVSLFRDCELTDDEARALVFIKEVGEIDNAIYRDVNKVDTLTASGHLRKLRNHGLLEQQGRGSGTFYVPGKRISDTLCPNPGGLSGNLTPLSGNLGGEEGQETPSEAQDPLLALLPADIQADITALGKRVDPGVLDDLVGRVCRCQPMSKQDLACLLLRSEKHIQDCLRRMQHAGKLNMLYPDVPNHPDQKYLTTK